MVNTLMFLPGSTKVCGEVNVLEDNSQEEAEVFQVSLLAPERIEISRRTAKVTIQDTTSSNVLWGDGIMSGFHTGGGISKPKFPSRNVWMFILDIV